MKQVTKLLLFFPFSFILFFLIFSARGWSCAFHSAGLPPREREPTYLTSFPTVMLAITFFTASFFRSFLSLFNSAFNSNISPANVTVLKASVCNLLCYVGLESSCCVFSLWSNNFLPCFHIHRRKTQNVLFYVPFLVVEKYFFESAILLCVLFHCSVTVKLNKNK